MSSDTRLKNQAAKFLLLLAAAFLPACKMDEWVTTDGGHSYHNRKGEEEVYSPRTSHGFRTEFELTLESPTSENLPDWQLASVAADGTVTLSFIALKTTHTISAGPGQTFPQYGNQLLRVIESSPEDGTVRLELSAR